MRSLSFIYCLGALFLLANCSPKLGGKNKGLKLVWADEFTGSEPINRNKWDFDLGGNGWGNNEKQYYTDRTMNARQLSGNLIIEAHKENYDDNAYSSARLVTRGKQTWGPGHRISVRAKMPSGRGTWPAIWMLGDNLKQVGWPLCGEIDIMEHVGYAPDSIYATVHTKAVNHIIGNSPSGTATADDLETNFHIYSLDWKLDRLEFRFNGNLIHTYKKPQAATEAEWPFSKPQYLLLNLAVGGNWGGRQGIDDTIWPQRMEVDWVRVWEL